MKIGILSDTHGHLPAKIFTIFKNIDHILHAGDIGDQKIIDKLKILCPVSAIYGNIDRWPVTSLFKNKLLIELAGKKILLIHDIVNIKNYSFQLFKNDISPDIVIYGHTHKLNIEKYRNILYINPGSISKPRSGKYGTAVILKIEDNTLEYNCVELK